MELRVKTEPCPWRGWSAKRLRELERYTAPGDSCRLFEQRKVE